MRGATPRRCDVVRAACLALVALAAVSGGSALAQEPAPPAQTEQIAPPPTFKTGVDVVVLDVSVLDKQGHPVRDLKAQDFDVRVDGKPRKAISADVIEFTAAAAPAEAPPPHDDYSTNEGSAPGRAVVLVMDLASFRAGEERAAVLSASSFLDTLSKSDVVAVTQLPWLSSMLAFSSDREQARKALVSSVGMKQEHLGTTTLGIAETVQAAKGDRYAWRQIVLRECRVQAVQPVPMAPSAACSGPGYEPECPCQVQDRLRADVEAYASEIRMETDRQLQGLLDLLSALRAFTGPKLVVVVSRGIVLDDASFGRALAATAGLANARVHVLRPETALMDASSGQAIERRAEDIRMAHDGLDLLAGLLGGRVYAAIGDPRRQLERIWQENAASWRLGVDPEPTDLDGKPHRLEVKVRRPGLSVLARASFLPDPAAREAATPTGRLRDALFSPVQAAGLPLRATHYVAPPAAAGGAFLVRIVVEIDGVPAKAERPSVGFVVVDMQGKQVAGGVGHVSHEPDGVHASVFSAVVKLQPGRYLARVAAAAADGRVGSVERHFDLAAPEAGSVALGDLLLAEYGGPDTPLEPRVRPTLTNGQLLVYADVAPVQGATPESLELQVAQGPTQAPLVRERVAVKAAPGGRSAVSAVVPVLRLGDGEYVARLVAASAVPPLEGGWRTFRVATDASAALRSVTTVAAFDRRAVLGGDLMTRVLAELSDRPAAADPAIANALRDVEAGRFPQADATPTNEDDPATPAMIRGFGLLAAGQLDEAASAFKTAMREAPDLSLALAYVGSCFAAGGLDREAAGAWQTALIEEKRVPVLYTLLADAWLRLNEPAKALEVLDRAVARWPADADLKRRRAVALARAGKRADALAEVDALLAAAPDDAASACAGFRIAVDRASPGKVADDKTRAYATACASGSAPESPLAAGWLETPQKKRR